MTKERERNLLRGTNISSGNTTDLWTKLLIPSLQDVSDQDKSFNSYQIYSAASPLYSLFLNWRQIKCKSFLRVFLCVNISALTTQTDHICINHILTFNSSHLKLSVCGSGSSLKLAVFPWRIWWLASPSMLSDVQGLIGRLLLSLKAKCLHQADGRELRAVSLS